MSGNRRGMSLKMFDSPPSLRPPTEEQLEKRRMLKEDIAKIKLYDTLTDTQKREIRERVFGRGRWAQIGGGII